MINKLIEKYKGKIDHNNKLQKQLNTVGSYATDLYNDNEVCEEILQDLEELKAEIDKLSKDKNFFANYYYDDMYSKGKISKELYLKFKDLGVDTDE